MKCTCPTFLEPEIDESDDEQYQPMLIEPWIEEEDEDDD